MSMMIYTSFSAEHAGRMLAESVVDSTMTGPTELDGGVSTNSAVAETITETRDVHAAIYHGTPMEWAYHTKQLVPASAVFTFVRESAKDGSLEMGEWELRSIAVFGRVAKKDGSPGEQRGDTEFRNNKAPQWLLDAAERHAPEGTVS